MDTLINLGIFLVLLIGGYISGTIAEKRHYESIEARERNLLNLPAVSIKNVDLDSDQVTRAWLVYGNVVISVDYFKRFLAQLRNLFGGEVKSYESLIDRARREATLRMKEMAQAGNATIIVNVRLETSAIGSTANRKSIGSIEAIAYGTAVAFKPTHTATP